MKKRQQMSDQINMPTPCYGCGGIWDLNKLQGWVLCGCHDYDSCTHLVCPACKEQETDND